MGYECSLAQGHYIPSMSEDVPRATTSNQLSHQGHCYRDAGHVPGCGHAVGKTGSAELSVAEDAPYFLPAFSIVLLEYAASTCHISSSSGSHPLTEYTASKAAYWKPKAQELPIFGK